MATFIGIDLAWKGDRNHTGAAAFRGDAARIVCVGLSRGISTLDAVLSFVAEHEESDTIIAVDAPLIIRNDAGQRPCETLLSRRFSKYHAGAHTSNLTLYPDAGGVKLARRLQSRGYTHCSSPDEPWDPGKRRFFEVYPHPAHVILFERDRIIKYKKGPVSARREGLREFQAEITARIFGPKSPFVRSGDVADFLAIDPSELRGQRLKEHEDVLDSILCAYLAFHLWRWGWRESEMIGDLAAGYIVVPRAPLQPPA
jgi:predicted RNase H-like nuclease